MKNLPLKLMYLLVITLLVYSCTKDQFTSEKIVENQFQLVSPDQYVLASSDAELYEKVKQQLTLDLKEDVAPFTIKRVNYNVYDNLTDAEIIYQFEKGGERNLIFYWLHDEVTTHALTADPLPVPSCIGGCGHPWDPDPCRSIYNINTQQYRCSCKTYNVLNDCKMTVTGGPGTFSCGDNECTSDGDTYTCQVAYNPSTGDVECICIKSGGTGCGAVIIELENNDLGIDNL